MPNALKVGMIQSREWLEPVDFLKACLAERMSKNQMYSLRAFARDLKLSPSYLSLLFNGKRQLKLEQAEKLSSLLKLENNQKQRFLSLVAYQSLSDPMKEFVIRAKEYNDLSIERKIVEFDKFGILEKWYHLAILDLCTCKDFQSDPQWIAGRLQIDDKEAQSALERLTRQGLLKRRGSKLFKSGKHISFPSKGPLPAVRSFHQQMIDKAAKNLLDESQTAFELRHISSVTVAVDVEKLQEAKEEIINFKQKMAKLMTTKNSTEVYQLNIQLFPLSHKFSLKKES